jgi:hypothetical protein
MLLDIAKIDTDRDGLSDFAWPLNRQTHIDAMRLMASSHNDFVSSRMSESPTSIELFHGYLISLIASLFQAERLNDLRSDAYVIPGHALYWRFVLSGEDIPLRFVSQLRGGLPSNFVRRWLRRYKPSWAMHGLRSCGLDERVFKGNIISTAGTNSLVLEHAALVDEKVYVCPLYEWFAPPSASDLRLIESRCVDNDHVDQYVSMVADLFGQFGIKSGERSLSYIKKWIIETTKYITFYCDRLESRHGLLPKKLWINSIGIPWNAMLAYATRKAGGTVTVHDHALGANASLDSHTAFVELRNSDCFLTYSGEIKRLLEASTLGGTKKSLRPEILSVSELGRLENRVPIVRPPKTTVGCPVKSIMYIQPMFMTDVGEINPLMPDVVAADWQMRLLRALCEEGYRVLVKPHPRTRINLPYDFFTSLGVDVLTDDFENVYDSADVLLYDYTLSTTFGSGLRTDRHVVLIDFGYSDLPEHILDKLDRRVARTIGWFDEHNRAQVDWHALRESIAAIKDRGDESFVREVLGG